MLTTYRHLQTGFLEKKWYRHQEVGTSVPTLIQTGNNKRGLRSTLVSFRSSPPEEVNRLVLAMETDLLRMVWLITYRQMLTGFLEEKG